ncbi:GntR family transcriptional regulator [Streptomyces sp. CAU 1734]|uniref:GntR family transcriptional regulator n=1 Tax=Streptomyces sp. CAU 1734 TaxID=3140360 RepID=UPI0032617338
MNTTAPAAGLILSSPVRTAIRADLSRAGQLPVPESRTAAALARDAAELHRRLRHWMPTAEACRRAEDTSPSARARWDELLHTASQPLSPAPSIEYAIGLSVTLREMLRGVLRAAGPGPSIAEVTEHLTESIATAVYLPGSAVSPDRIAAQLDCPSERVRHVLTDLTARGALHARGARLVITTTDHQHTEQARYVAGQLRAQIGAGLHPPGTGLPAASSLARRFVCQQPVIVRALALLSADGLIRVPPAGRATVLDTARNLPPARRAARLARKIPAPADEAIDPLLRDVHRQWIRRATVPPAELTHQWGQLRALAHAQTRRNSWAPDTVPAHRLLAQLAAAPLPKSAWLRPWHLAVLAAALRAVLPARQHATVAISVRLGPTRTPGAPS